MESPKKPDQPCPGPTKTARSRVESLREKRERLRDEMRKASAQLAEAEAKAERLARIESRRQERLERDQLGSLCKRVGLGYRLSLDANNPDAPAPLDTQLIGGALSWLSKKMSVMSPEDMDVMRKEGAALVLDMPDKKKDAHGNRDAPHVEMKQGEMERPLAFDLPE
jgi:hypothetical protein